MPPFLRPGCCLAAIVALGQAPAYAQQLEEVVISASRAQMRSFDAPAAVQLIDRQAIEGGGPQINLSESLVRAPGLTILDRQNYAQDLQISIRGFGARSAFGVRGIRLLIDGIPATTPDGQGQSSSVSLTSTDRLEVLRGPLAQLYGNSSGGVIQAFTKDASKEPTVGYQYYLGSYGMRRADYQFSDTVGGYGLVADYGTFSTSGYRANSAAERKQFNGKLSFAPNAQTKVNVVFNRFDMPLAQDPLGLTRAQLTGDPTQAGNNSIGKFTRKVVLQNQLGSSAQTAIDADNALTARAYYGTRENLQYQASTTWVGLNRTYYGTGLQYNGRTQWQGIPLELAAGYEFDKSSERRQGGESVQGEKKSGSPTPLTRDEDNEAQNNDFFVQATAHVSEQISIVGGIRRSNIAFNSSDKFLSDTKDGSGSASFSATSPVLGITWHANNNLNLYINYGKGFESPTLAEMAYSGTTAPVALFNPLLNASSSQHYEIGAKWVPLRDARVDLAVYQIDSSDEIVTAASASGQTSFKNAPGTARTGWELAAASQLSEHLSARLSASSIDAKYSQTFKSSTTTIASGNKIPGIPDSSTFAEIVWTSEAFTKKTKAPLGSRVALEWQQAGRIFANDLNTESADGRNVFNVSLSQRWAWNQGLVTAYGRINNVSDVRYVGSVIVNQAASQFYEPAMPQNWMLGLSLSMPLR
ncbi:MAG: TonB-dependent receptor [Rhodoferax sp.]|nr:TonB-dependent receptor [Rhodoferax sp.]MBJ7467337.1 TonB-dependent receptor [Rhodoferax sp.]